MAWTETTFSRSRFGRIWPTLLFLITLLALAAPQAALGQPRFPPEVALRKPQFAVTAVKIKSIHETGTNWPGNDEVEVLLSDFTDKGVGTAWFYNVDAGETFQIAPKDQCIQPQPACDRGVTDVHFRVALWENDEAPAPLANFCYGDFPPGNYWFSHGLCSGDDLIGHAEITIPREQLLAELPTVGATVDKTVRPAGGDGTYEFTYRITRLADAGRDVVIGQPIELGITLQTAVTQLGNDRWEVTLSWANAAGNSVDVYRNGAVLTTTANDGSHADAVRAGTYVYRVCNAGTTACSPDASVTVP